MTLDTLIRQAVSLTDTSTTAIQVVVQHYAWTGQSVSGDPSFAAPIARDAVVEYGAFLRQTLDNRLVQSVAHVTFLRPISANGTPGRTEPVDTRDMISLPSGLICPIVDIGGVIDPTTDRPYFSEVWLGIGGSTGA